MPKTTKTKPIIKTFKKKIYKDIPEEEKKLKPSFNFHDFMEDSKKKLKKEYKKEKQHVEYSTYADDEFIPR